MVLEVWWLSDWGCGECDVDDEVLRDLNVFVFFFNNSGNVFWKLKLD